MSSELAILKTQIEYEGSLQNEQDYEDYLAAEYQMQKEYEEMCKYGNISFVF